MTVSTGIDLSQIVAATPGPGTATTVGPQEGENSYRWATVTVSSPLTIQLDGDAAPLPITPESLMAGDPPIGARVWVQLFGRRVIVLGTSGVGSGESPIGAVLSYAGSTAPTGWIICNGAAVSRTTFATLFAVIGTSFGAGNGSTTFNVPDLRDRVPIGVGTSHTLAATGGATTASVTLSTANLPAHDHGSAGSHDHDAIGDHTHTATGIAGSSGVNDGTAKNLQTTTVGTTSANGGHQHANDGVHTHSSVGSGTAFSVSTVQPFQVLNSIIRAS